MLMLTMNDTADSVKDSSHSKPDLSRVVAPHTNKLARVIYLQLLYGLIKAGKQPTQFSVILQAESMGEEPEAAQGPSLDRFLGQLSSKVHILLSRPQHTFEGILDACILRVQSPSIILPLTARM